MESSPIFLNLLIIVGGLSWITLYGEAVRVGLRDKSYAIPLWAIGLNFSWAVIYTIFAGRLEGPSHQVVLTSVRLVLDILIFYTWFRFGVKHFPSNPGEQWFVQWSLLVIAVCFILQGGVILQFGLYSSLAYMAFLQNLAMSLLFIAMLARRKRRKAQSMVIAYAKLTGSLAPTILYGVLGTALFHGPNYLLLVIGILSCLFDLIYISLLSKAKPYEKKEQTTTIIQRNMTGGEFDAFRV
jgi:predicted neutral ceramidase superfamily lipid hydrolase